MYTRTVLGGRVDPCKFLWAAVMNACVVYLLVYTQGRDKLREVIKSVALSMLEKKCK